MNKNKEKIIIGTIAFSVFFYMLYTHFTNIDELDRSGIIGIGRVIDFGYCSGGSNCGDYEYYYNNKKYISTFTTEINYSFNKKEKIVYKDKYFVILFSKENPEISEIYLNKEIKDIKRIKNNGFD